MYGERVSAGRAFVIAAALALVFLWFASPARATEFTVTNTDESGTGSLWRTVTDANANDGPDTIEFDNGATGEISLSGRTLRITDDLTINGPGASELTVNGDGALAVFEVAGGVEFTLNGVTVSGGEAFGSGGGVSNNEGALTINDSVISGNSAELAGGGVSNNEGTMTINDSVISDNSAPTAGGVYSTAPSVTSGDPNPSRRTTINNSTISGNESSSRGGGVFNSNGLMVIENSTIADNTAPDGGSGVASYGDDETLTEISSSVIAGNTNSDVDFVSGRTNSFQSDGRNVIGNGNATDAFDETGDQTGVDAPDPGDLADDGAETQTDASTTPDNDDGDGTDVASSERRQTTASGDNVSQNSADTSDSDLVVGFAVILVLILLVGGALYFVFRRRRRL